MYIFIACSAGLKRERGVWRAVRYQRGFIYLTTSLSGFLNRGFAVLY